MLTYGCRSDLRAELIRFTSSSSCSFLGHDFEEEGVAAFGKLLLKLEALEMMRSLM